MNAKMFKTPGFLVVLCIALSIAFVQAPKQCYARDEISIDLAQSIINLQSSINVITFHTNIKLYDVDCATVTLKSETEPPASVPVYLCRSDSRGYFLAEFLMQHIKDLRDNLEIGEENLFVLEGKTKDGSPFSGTQDILVVDNKPQGRPEDW